MKASNVRRFLLISSVIFSTILSGSAFSAISLDRTRVIFDGSQKSISLNIGNKNKQLPYLAQGWIENTQGQKITSPFVVLPPIQRLEPNQSSQIRIEALPAAKSLPQDRESLFYFNLREIPPKSEKANVLQLALQSKVKMFYRPKALMDSSLANWQDKLELVKQGETVKLKNPTPFYITIINAASSTAALAKSNFSPVMIAPFDEVTLVTKASTLGSTPVLTYINDFGGRPDLQFKCQSNVCQVVSDSQ